MALSFVTTVAALLAVQSAHTEYTDYEVDGKAHPAVEVLIDKGVVRELIVKCEGKDVSGIVVHTPSEGVFTDSQFGEHKTLDAAIKATCAV